MTNKFANAKAQTETPTEPVVEQAEKPVVEPVTENPVSEKPADVSVGALLTGMQNSGVGQGALSPMVATKSLVKSGYASASISKIAGIKHDAVQGGRFIWVAKSLEDKGSEVEARVKALTASGRLYKF